MKQFHEDRFANSNWNAEDIRQASMGIVAERSFLTGRRKELFTNASGFNLRMSSNDQMLREAEGAKASVPKAAPSKATPPPPKAPPPGYQKKKRPEAKGYSEPHTITGLTWQMKGWYLKGSSSEYIIRDIFTQEQLEMAIASWIHPIGIAYMQKVSWLCRLFHRVQHSRVRDWSYNIETEDSNRDDLIVSLETTYLALLNDSHLDVFATPSYVI
eukprot:659968-Amphidinium_carterae.7